MKIRINDSVIVQTGKDKGKSGTVTRILIKTNKIIVEGINKQTKHVKGRNGQAGERVEFFAPIDISNVAIIDPKSGKPTRIGYKFEGNQKMRIAKKSGEQIVPNKKANQIAKKSNTSKDSKK